MLAGALIAGAVGAATLGPRTSLSEEEGAGGAGTPSAAASPTAEEIMKKVAGRPRPRTFLSYISIFTQESAGGRPLLQKGSIAVDSSGATGEDKTKNDYRMAMILKDPPDFAGSKAYDERRNGVRTQLICPRSMQGQCRPVPSGSSQFFGTEIEWEDINQADPDRFQYEMEREETDQWIIRGKVKADPSMGYLIRVDKAEYDVRSILKYKDGKLFKEVRMQERKSITGLAYPIPTIIDVENKLTGRTSTMTLVDPRAGVKIPPEMLRVPGRS
ncbi:MAG: outer membrane lipoprotein-sorting protein [Nitrospirae bacterium]|nr:outer membrane lipoprotein-sorting protein [Nitrospirota bacterium]